MPVVRRLVTTALTLAGGLLAAVPALAQEHRPGGEANLILPDLNSAQFLGVGGHTLLLVGLLVSGLGLLFGLAIYQQLKGMPVHRSMREVSELIYETCQTYLQQQGRFLMILWLFIGAIVLLYFGRLAHTIDPITGADVYGFPPLKVAMILLFSLVGMGGSYGVAWFGIRVNTFANSRTAFAALEGKPYPCYAIPLKAGMSIGMALISVELLLMLVILLFVPHDYAGPCFIGFAIGESLGAAALRIAGGIFTKIADIGSDLMKIVFKIKEDDARNPGVIADCVGDNAGDSVGPSADGFETYGVTGVALITFIMLAVREPLVQVQLLVWIFMMRIIMVIASGLSYFINEGDGEGALRQRPEDELRAPADEPRDDHVGRVGGADLHHVVPADPDDRRRRQPVVEAGQHHHLRHARGRDHPGTREGVHVGGLEPRPRSREQLRRGRRLPEHPVGPRGRQLLGVLAGPDHRVPDGHRLVHQRARARGR